MSAPHYPHLPPTDRMTAMVMDLRAWRRNCAVQYMSPAEIEALDAAIALLEEQA